MHKSLKPMNFTYFGLDGDDEDQLLVTGSIVMQSVKHLVRFSKGSLSAPCGPLLYTNIKKWWERWYKSCSEGFEDSGIK